VDIGTLSVSGYIESMSVTFLQPFICSAAVMKCFTHCGHTSVTGTAYITSPILYSSADWSQTINKIIVENSTPV
jgi:hypothetical protein